MLAAHKRTAGFHWVPLVIHTPAVQWTQVTHLAVFNDAITTVPRLDASEHASACPVVRSIHLAEVAFFRAVHYCIPAERPPRALGRAAAVYGVVVRPRTACRDRHRSIAAVALFSCHDDTVTAATTWDLPCVAGHAAVELAGTTNLDAGFPWPGALPAGFNRLAVS